MNPIAWGYPHHWRRQILGIRHEYVILTVAWRPLANTFIHASGGMSATADILVFTITIMHMQPMIPKSVSQSVCLSRWCVVSKRLSQSSCDLHRFTGTKIWTRYLITEDVKYWEYVTNLLFSQLCGGLWRIRSYKRLVACQLQLRCLYYISN